MATLLAFLQIAIIPKTMNMSLAEGLEHHEFKCKCARKACHYTLVAESLRTTFDTLRKRVGFKLTINSGFRCQMHNAEVGGIPESSHSTGHAIDIATHDLSLDQLETLIETAQELFDVVIIYETFIHCHMRGE